MAKLLDREAILKADDLPVEEMEIPEWGGVVRIRAMSGKERDAYEESIILKRKDGEYETVMSNMRAKLLVRTIVDENDKPLFTTQDLELLGGKSADVLSRLFQVAARLSGISRDDVEELAKNSESAQNGDFGSV